jgi:hypothetical protein
MSSEQEAFNKVWDWFVVQRKPAGMGKDNVYMYRCRDGSRCAVGVLIPDDEYSPTMEPEPAIALRNTIPALYCIPGHFLNTLQGIHDEAASQIEAEFHGVFYANLEDMGESWGLTIPTTPQIPA